MRQHVRNICWNFALTRSPKHAHASAHAHTRTWSLVRTDGFRRGWDESHCNQPREAHSTGMVDFRLAVSGWRMTPTDSQIDRYRGQRRIEKTKKKKKALLGKVPPLIESRPGIYPPHTCFVCFRETNASAVEQK